MSFIARTTRLYWRHRITPDTDLADPDLDLGWLMLLPTPTPPDGRQLDGLLLAQMVAEWNQVSGGGRIDLRRTALRWAHISDDLSRPGWKRSEGESHDVCAVYHHARARAMAAGHPAPHTGDNQSGNAFFETELLLNDAPAVLFAVLDRYLTGAGDWAAWYLDSPCRPDWCLYHGGRTLTGRLPWMAPALDWSTRPVLYWRPGAGTVAVAPDRWRGAQAAGALRMRLPSPALIPTEPPEVAGHHEEDEDQDEDSDGELSLAA